MLCDNIPYINNDLTKLKVGDRIWSIQSGWSNIKAISLNMLTTNHRYNYFFNGKK
jgi:hypothetical protein